MPRVELEILHGPYQPALALGLRVDACRLLTDVCLRGRSGWTRFQPGVVDTGAPLSLFPRRLWEHADVRSLGPLRVGGILRRQECMFEATLAVVTLAIRDAANQIAPVETHALLAATDEVPTLLGMRGVLTTLALHVDIARNLAYFES